MESLDGCDWLIATNNLLSLDEFHILKVSSCRQCPFSRSTSCSAKEPKGAHTLGKLKKLLIGITELLLIGGQTVFKINTSDYL